MDSIEMFVFVIHVNILAKEGSIMRDGVGQTLSKCLFTKPNHVAVWSRFQSFCFCSSKQLSPQPSKLTTAGESCKNRQQIDKDVMPGLKLLCISGCLR